MSTASETLTRVARIADLSDGETIVLKKGDNVVRGTTRIANGARRVDIGAGSAGPTVGSFTDAGYAIHRVEPMASLSRMFGGLTRLVVEPVAPLKPEAVIDTDGDRWTLRPNGEYALEEDGPDATGYESLASLRATYGPLKTPGGVVIPE
ncbi:hypothetical protein MTE01_29120 [Microbacterium testaceum]|uniref:Uncharacterized protein n=1 Tax=Microbacterium testaceum TaxID=2033 RepID=A0A4Y3QQF7_MICTE|nr:hypothetical protein [Microbacterium testaceum]GEB46967.1 hypothetical protein MTE01_29120 [Microbacterium testaceum]